MTLYDFETLLKLNRAILLAHINSELIEVARCNINHLFLSNSTSTTLLKSWIWLWLTILFQDFLLLNITRLFTYITLFTIFFNTCTHLRGNWSWILVLRFLFFVWNMLVVLLVLIIEKRGIFIVLLKIFLRGFVSFAVIYFKLFHLFLSFLKLSLLLFLLFFLF
jgi:hypothetical protein